MHHVDNTSAWLSVLQRFVQTGVPHIANKKRSMVALHKVGCNNFLMLCNAICWSAAVADIGIDNMMQIMLLVVEPLQQFWGAHLALSSELHTAHFGSYIGNLARLGSQWQAHWARKQVQAHKSRKEK
jgi:hypothetical protein